jgi:hypothetical protein
MAKLGEEVKGDSFCIKVLFEDKRAFLFLI